VTTNDQDTSPPDLEPVAELAPVTIAGVQPRSRSGRVLNLALGAALAIAVAGVAFAVGRGTAPVSAATGGRNAFGGPGASFQPGGGQGFRGGFGSDSRLSISGTVTAIGADSMTITTSSGATVEVSINGNTAYHQQSAATSADVSTGKTVVVQVEGFGGRGGGGPGSSPAPSSGTTTAPTATDITVVP
jgi:hypothetical protein